MLCMVGCFEFKFAILVAGFKSRSSGHSVFYSTPVTCPTLHVFGDTDRVIPKGIESVVKLLDSAQKLSFDFISFRNYIFCFLRI